MKKTIWLLGAFFLGGTLLATPVVSATTTDSGTANGNTTVGSDQPVLPAIADPSASLNSTAKFTVEAGQLTLKEVPDLNFGAAKPEIIVNGGSQDLDDKNAGKLIVSDMRGTGSGWSLSASMNSEFTSGTSKLEGLSLTLAATGSNTFLGSDKTLYLNGTTKSDTQTSVFSAKKYEDSGVVGETTFKLNTSKSASLNFPEKTNSTFTANASYQSTVTWTLVAAQ
ncbi:WxL domain-containing protein [Lactococcus taiwanensis]|uniref:WxL domain-containing protein n=1 Tax=Lactococcus taiwanensis TaxID=1151742 RepID=UPI0028AC44FA|nr:WxL domain-containing protein [Lactococcus taiwanensis]